MPQQKNQKEKVDLKNLLNQLKENTYTIEEKSQIMTYLLQGIGILPLRDCIEFSEQGGVIINGKLLEPEQVNLLQQGADTLKNNWTRKVIRDQMKYNALMLGIIGNNTEQILFAKAVNWILMQEEEWIGKLNP